MAVRWLTLFIDRPEATFDGATAFWQRATGTTQSPTRGASGQFATLVPVDGDPHIRVQRVDQGPGGTHLDLHTDEPSRLVDEAIDLGATLLDDEPVRVLRSPGGYPWCVVDWHGEATPSRPYAGPSGAPSRLDQICLDVTADHVDAEVRFWAGLLGWPATTSTARPEFTSLARPESMPIRLLFQRLDAGDGPTAGHLDLAAGERVADVVADHVAAGAEVESRERLWTVLRDPSGHRYCVTRRDPSKGIIDQPPRDPIQP